MTKTVRKDQLFYSKYCSSGTLINNGQFVVMTDYVFLKFDYIHTGIVLIQSYNNSPSTRSGECRRTFEHCHCWHWHRCFI